MNPGKVNEHKSPPEPGGEEAGKNERREQVLRAIAEGELSVGVEWFGLARQICSVILRAGGGCLRAGDLLGLTARFLHVLFARDLLPRSKQHKNEDFALLEGVALEVATRALPSVVRLAGISAIPGRDGNLEYKVKAWWFAWNRRVEDPANGVDESAEMTRRIWQELRSQFLAPADVQVAGVKEGMLRSKEEKELEDQRRRSRKGAATEVVAVLWELLGDAHSDSGILFVGHDGRVRVGHHEVRDKLGKPGMEEKGKASLNEPEYPDAAEGKDGDLLFATIPSETEPEVEEVVQAAESASLARDLVQALRDLLVVEEQRATSRAAQVVARHFMDLSSKQITLKDLAGQEEVAESSLSEARKKLVERVSRDPRFKPFLEATRG